jgi:hypothetical protein
MPYVQFEEMFYMPTGDCSRGYKLRSREGESPKSLDVVVSCGCSMSVVMCCSSCSSRWTLVFTVPASPFIVQLGLVYKG